MTPTFRRLRRVAHAVLPLLVSLPLAAAAGDPPQVPAPPGSGNDTAHDTAHVGHVARGREDARVGRGGPVRP